MLAVTIIRDIYVVAGKFRARNYSRLVWSNVTHAKKVELRNTTFSTRRVRKVKIQRS